MDNKWDCDEDSKGNDESRTESSIFLANTHKVMNRIVVEEGTRRIILAKSQMEMRNSFENQIIDCWEVELCYKEQKK